MNGNGIYSLLPLLLLIVIMYFLLIRPQKKKEKQVNEMRSNIKVGDEVVTIGGIHGTVCKVKDEYLTIQVGSDKTKLEMTRWSISNVLSNDPAPKKSARDEAAPAKKSRPKRLDQAEKTEPVEEAPQAEAVSPEASAPEAAEESEQTN